MLDRRDAMKAVMATGLGIGQVLLSPEAARATARNPPAGRPALGTLDMVHANPGEGPPRTRYLDPHFLRGRGYDGFVIERAIEAVPTFAAYDPGLIPPGSEEAQLALTLKTEIGNQIARAKQDGLAVYAWVQYVVLPKRLLVKHGHRFVDAMGRLDVQLPATQEVLRAFTQEILTTFPDLDGLVIRTGEIYLHDLPFHESRVPKAIGETNDSLIQSGTAIIQGEKSHLALLSVLRDAVCVKANKKLLYRTWDFGNNFHNNARYYCDVTDAIAPHENLKFSIKHQRGDFHRLTPLNPTLGIGRHQQVIEVQCQMEGYGKGAYPYYVANGVIDGWEEYGWLMPEGAPRSVRDLTKNPLISGLWTWSRGGGWDGPYSADELWCDLNAYVLVTFAQDTSRAEASIFEQYGREVLTLTSEDTQTLRSICLTSASAVLRGQLTNLGADIDLWWARDDTLSEPQLSDFLSKGLVEEAILEKQRAVAMWQDIAAQMPHIRFSHPERQSFAEVSATYGLLKHAVIAAGWTACLLFADGQRNGSYDKRRIQEALNRYDRSWDEWRRLKAENPLCPSLPKQLARGDRPGLGAAMDRIRKSE